MRLVSGLLLAATLSLLQAQPFDATGLQNAPLVRNLHDGRFNFIRPEDDYLINLFFIKYVYRFADACSEEAYLPTATRVEITELRCKTFTSLMDGPTPLITVCKEYMEVPTRKFADPRFARVLRSVSNTADAQRVGKAMNSGANGFKVLLNGAEEEQSTSADTPRIFQRNACGSPGLTMFAENLLRRVGNRPSVQAERGDAAALQTVQGAKNEAWESACREQITTILPGAQPSKCGCFLQVFSASLDAKEMDQMRTAFSREEFLPRAASKTGLAEKVGACLR